MALFVLICHDRPGALEVRMATREAHLAYVRGHTLPIKIAGPILDANDAMAGSILVFDADNQAQVEAFADQDPYALAGLFERREILPWKISLGGLA